MQNVIVVQNMTAYLIQLFLLGNIY